MKCRASSTVHQVAAQVLALVTFRPRSRPSKGHLTITCGIDWAEGHHDVALVDADGRRIAKLRIDTGPTGSTELMTLLAGHGW